MASRLISRIRLNSQSVLFKNNINSLVNASKFLKLDGTNCLAAFHSSPSLFEQIQIKMPALSPTMTEGTIVKWHKKEGDKISPGDMLFEVQTDKAVMAFELEEEGTIAKILIPQDPSVIQVGTLVAILVGPGEDWKNVSVPAGASAPAKPQESQASAEAQSAEHHNFDKKIGPAARNLIHSYNIDPSQIQATGPHGLILKSEPGPTIVSVTSAPPAAAAQSAPAPRPQHPDQELDYEDIEITNMRKVIAKRLLFSKTTVPHSYASVNVVVDKIVDIRKEMIKNNQKVSLNDFIIKAIGLALRMVPELNANYQESDGNYKILPTVDVSVAVATDKGLITPIVKNADKLSVLQISEEVKALADKARKGKLLPHEFQGGSFSISNLGMFGITEFSAVINPPQAGILAVGKSQLKLNLDMQKQTEVAFTLSFDERCLDMDRAIKFLNSFNYFINNPSLLIEPTQEF